MFDVLKYGEFWYQAAFLVQVLVTYALIGLSVVAVIGLIGDATQPASRPSRGAGSIPPVATSRTVPRQPVSMNSPATYDQLERIHRLYQEGALSSAEFEYEKRRLLS